MLLKLFILFVVLPVLDLWLLIKVGKAIGTWPAIIVILGPGVFGAGLVKVQGGFLFNKIRIELIRGRMPTQELISGLCVLVGGILLITPGIITDLAGLILLIPPTRLLVVEVFGRWLRKRFELGDFFINHLSRGREKADDDEF